MRGLEGLETRGNAAIHGGVQQHFLDLIHGHAIGQRAFDMELDLVRRLQRCQHGEIEHAAGLSIEARPGPGITPAPLGGDLLEGHHEVVGLGDAAVDVVLAQNVATDGQTLFEMFAFTAHDVLRG